MQKHQDQREIRINANLSTRCKLYVQHLKLEIAVWDYDRLGPSEVIGSVVLAGGKDLSGQAAL